MRLAIQVDWITLTVFVLALFAWLVVKARTQTRTYQEEKEQAEKDAKIDRLEAELARERYIL